MNKAVWTMSLLCLMGVAMAALPGCADKKKSEPVADNNDDDGKVDPRLKDLSKKQQKALMELSEDDRTLALKQKTCPVGNEPLGSMGKPVKIAPPEGYVGDAVFVCCKSCTKSVTDKPETHFTKLDPRLKDHKPEQQVALMKLTDADRTLALKQKKCPVGGLLGSMGKPVKVEPPKGYTGDPVFVCCKGCTESITDKPDKYFKKVAMK